MGGSVVAAGQGWIVDEKAVATACRRWTATIVVAGLSLIAGCAALPPSRVYVWQRAWNPRLARALAEHAPGFAAVDVLAAEIGFTGERPTVAVTNADWSLFSGGETAVGVVVRIGPLPRREPSRAAWEPTAVETTIAIATCRTALARAEAGRAHVAELQIDFDASTAHLGEYAGFIRRLRSEFQPRKIVVTALPTWLGSPAWKTLAEAADGFVLQVHSLVKPTAINDPVVLFDRKAATTWVRAAAAAGRPFRVALPAYGYRVGFAATGAFLGLEAESEPRAWPAGTVFRDVMADPAEVAQFVAELANETPPGCEGLAWFRFPSPTDTRAWRWPTLAAVMAGTVPTARLRAHARPADDDSITLSVENEGSCDGAADRLLVRWTGGRLISGDGIGGATLRRLGTHSALVSLAGVDGAAAIVSPGDNIPTAWLRFDRAPAITCEVP